MKTEGEIMSNKTRKGLFESVKVLREGEMLTSKEAKAFKQVIIKADEKDFSALEDTLLEAAENSSRVMEDINKLAELIYPEFEDQESAVQFVKANAQFQELEYIGFDVFQVRANNYGDEGTYLGKKAAFHAVITVKYEGIEYGFGFNKTQNTVSYKMDDEGPFYDNMKKKIKDYDKALEIIKYVVQYVLGVM